MERLLPNWNQPRPTWSETEAMLQRIGLTNVSVELRPFQVVLESIRNSHANGGAVLCAFHVSPDEILDWFISRNRLLEDGILASILSRPEVRECAPELMIPDHSTDPSPTACPLNDVHEFNMESPFLFEGRLAQCLHSGGAYSKREGDGRAEKQLALNFCDSAFGLRFGDLLSYVNFNPWTPWFYGIAWDWTSVLFDLKLRKLWFLAVTDTD